VRNHIAGYQTDGSYDFMFLNENTAKAVVSFLPQATYPATHYYTIYSISTATLVTSHTVPAPLNEYLLIALIPIGLAVFGVELWRTTRNKDKRRESLREDACPHCGEMNPSGNSFCGRCGSSLDATQIYDR
jgi:hypothetical protein